MKNQAVQEALNRRMLRQQKSFITTVCSDVPCVLCRQIIGPGELRMLVVDPEYWVTEIDGVEYTYPQSEPVHHRCLEVGEQEAVRRYWNE